MSRKGNCWDNAPTESFFNSLKNERVHARRYATREAARADLFEYLLVNMKNAPQSQIYAPKNVPTCPGFWERVLDDYGQAVDRKPKWDKGFMGYGRTPLDTAGLYLWCREGDSNPHEC